MTTEAITMLVMLPIAIGLVSWAIVDMFTDEVPQKFTALLDEINYK
jgi:hypothetical protein